MWRCCTRRDKAHCVMSRHRNISRLKHSPTKLARKNSRNNYNLFWAFWKPMYMTCTRWRYVLTTTNTTSTPWAPTNCKWKFSNTLIMLCQCYITFVYLFLRLSIYRLHLSIWIFLALAHPVIVTEKLKPGCQSEITLTWKWERGGGRERDARSKRGGGRTWLSELDARHQYSILLTRLRSFRYID